MKKRSTTAKNRRISGAIAVIPHAVMNCDEYVGLSGSALRLLLEMARQYNGHSNNGDLTAAWSVMRERGFKSEATLQKAVRELMEKEFIVRTREGQFCNPGKRCALYALMWANVDECPGKNLDIAPTKAPMRVFSAKITKRPLQKV